MPVLLLVATLLIALVSPAPASAQDAVQRAVESLRSDPVYNDPDAEAKLDDDEAAAVRAKIGEAGVGPVYVAILPESARAAAGGSTDGLIGEIHDQLRERATYVVVSGNQFRAGSELLEVRGLANDALQKHGDEGLEAILLG